MEKCPICNTSVPAAKLEWHVDMCFTKMEQAEKTRQIEKDARLASVLAPAASLSSSSMFYEENKADTYESYAATHTAYRLSSSKRIESMLDKLDKRRQGQPRVVHQKNVLTHAWKEKLRSELPNRFRLGDWRLLYSTQLDPIGMYTFYSTLEGKAPTILIVEDNRGHIFGAFLTDDWKYRGDRYYGKGESFLFSIEPRFAIYTWTKENDYFMLGEKEYFAVGGGGKFGIWIDSNFEFGSSAPCLTFNNRPLASMEQFQVSVVEVWGIKEF